MLFTSQIKAGGAIVTSNTGNVMHAPQMENVSTEVRRLSRCLSGASYPASESRQVDGEEQDTIKKVAHCCVTQS